MTSLKKIATVALLVSAVSGTTVMADSANGLGIGPIAAITPAATNGGVALTYFAPSYIASVTANYIYTQSKNSNTKVLGSTSTSQSMLGFSGILEMRKPITSSLNYDYGIAATVVNISNQPDGYVDPYAVGLTVGLDYQIAPKLIGYANFSPFSYVGNPDKSTTYAFLAQTTLGVSYLF
jgi:hypothetical protein